MVGNSNIPGNVYRDGAGEDHHGGNLTAQIAEDMITFHVENRRHLDENKREDLDWIK